MPILTLVQHSLTPFLQDRQPQSLSAAAVDSGTEQQPRLLLSPTTSAQKMLHQGVGRSNGVHQAPFIGKQHRVRSYVKLHCVKNLVQKSRRVHAAATLDTTTTASLSTQEGLIFPAGSAGAWDEGGVGHPVVRCFFGDNEERWYMWYSGRQGGMSAVDLVAPSSGSMGVAISTDGLTWTRGHAAVEGTRGRDAAGDVGAALTPNGDWWCFDTNHVAVSDVQILSSGAVQSGVGVYWCFYSGGDFQPLQVPNGLPGSAAQQDGSEPVEGLRMRPGLAMSQDARNWARIEGDHHTGALFDVGQPGEWDELFIGHPQVVAMGPRDMRMFYHSWDQSRQRYIIGQATSADGFHWKKQGVIFDPVAAGATSKDHDGCGAAACSVVRDVDNRQYLMFYEAVAAGGVRSVGLAVSKDGKQWKRCPQPVLTPTQSSADGEQGTGQPWDAGAVGAPCAVSMASGKWRLYYAGRASAAAGPWAGIGLALSQSDAATFENVPISFKRVGKQ